MENKAKIDLVIGLTALKAAGKDEFGKPLEKLGFCSYRASDAIRNECAKRGEDNPSVEMLQDVGDEVRRKTGDGGCWMRRLLAMAEKDGCRLMVINGIRNPVEIDMLEEDAKTRGFRFVLVGIVAPIMVRINRYMQRGQDGDTLAMEAFLKLDDRDRGTGQPPDGQQVDRCLARVPWENLHSNDGTLEEFHQWAVKFAQKHLDKYVRG